MPLSQFATHLWRDKLKLKHFMIITSLALFLCGLFVGGLAVFVNRRSAQSAAEQSSSQQILELTRENATLEANNASLAAAVEQSQVQVSELQHSHKAQISDLENRHRTELAAIETRHKQSLEDLENRHKQTIEDSDRRNKEAQEQTQQRIKAEFAVMADKILLEKSDQFKKANLESMEQMLQPFRENIASFRERVEKVYSDETQQRTSLKEQILQLTQMNNKMSLEANNLVAALKGSSKTQGDWGEMILETMLEASGLNKGVHYFTQQNFKDETGANKRPDVVIKLPDNKAIIVDSKVSIKAYVAYTEADDKDVMARALKEHLLSVRRHVDELATKNYPELIGDSAPDMVIMFVPNEPAFLLALQHDNELWRYAYERKVMISSPTNLFAVLKIVDDLWKRDLQSKNAMDIATEGGRLYDKFVGLAESLTDLGRSLDGTTKKYDDIMGKLQNGRGNLMTRVEKLRKLGARTSKSLPAAEQELE